MFPRILPLTQRFLPTFIRSPVSSTFNNQRLFKRNFHIHEYQGLNLLRDFGISVAEGDVATTPEEAEKIAKQLNTQDLIIKAQIHAGGRGKGHFDNGFKGGVHICNSPEEAKFLANKMLNHRLITIQSGPEGKIVEKVLVCKRHYIRRETYLAILLDRSHNGPVIVASSKGGMNIEQVAQEFPEDIHKEPINIFKGLQEEQAASIATKLGFKGNAHKEATQQMLKLYQFFVARDSTLVEINPFCETVNGNVLCVDSKINFDENALFRQPQLSQLSDPSQEDPREVEASKHNLNFIGLEGDIGCLVNGAGLAMATMDMIKFHGASPANFLDIGGGATDKQVTEALRIISSDKNVKSILVNIFGGIMRCDIIATGILQAVKTLGLHTHLVLRLQGTNVAEAKQILELYDKGLNRIMAVDDLDTAARKAVDIAKIVKLAEQANLNVAFELPL